MCLQYKFFQITGTLHCRAGKNLSEYQRAEAKTHSVRKSSEISGVELYSSWRNSVYFFIHLKYKSTFNFLSPSVWRESSNFLA